MPPRRKRYQLRDPDRTAEPCLHLAQEVTRLRMAVTLARNELRAGHHDIAHAILKDADSPTQPG